MKAPIFAPAITAWVAEGRDYVRSVLEVEATEVALNRKLIETREEANRRRIVAGAFLLKVRGFMPKRGTATDGWKAFLEAIELDDSTAHRWMDAAEPLRLTMRSKDEAAGPDDRETPTPSDGDAPPEETRVGGEEASGPPVDRDAWCTPGWITDAIGEFDLDPCANERSHVNAQSSFRLDRDQDGLEQAEHVEAGARVFVNPPYSDVMPWVQAYKHTRFCFLLKIDPSTKWFAALYEHVELILVPRGTRIEFEAPPGVDSSANQFPHGLFYARSQDASDAIKDLCFTWRTK